MKKLSPLDAAWLYVDSTDTPMHVGSLTIFSLPRNAPEDFLKQLFEQLRSHRRFAAPFNLKLRSAKLKSVLPGWVEDRRIDLDYHLRHSALPKPGGERELGQLIQRLHSHPMDFNRPLWECTVIEGLEGNRFALYMKMHHSLVDGVGGMRMLQRMLSPDAKARNQAPPWTIGYGTGQRERPRAPRTPLLQKLVQAAKEQATTAPILGRAFADTLRQAFKHTEPGWSTPFEGPKSILNGKVSGQRRFATQHYDLDRVRAVAKKTGVSLNDIFLYLCAAALRRYLDEIHALPDQPLTAGVPVSVRPADDDDAANAISFIIANLNTHLADPLERLRAIHDSANVAKQHLQALPKAVINNYTMVFMAPFILQLLAGLGGRARPMFNVTISNVPGPREALYFHGARLEQMYPVSLLSHGQALNITAVSYDGQFNIGFTGCRDTLPSMQRLAVYMGEAFDELEEAVKAA
ncbi:MAG TPA: wax ester/triacylglycerol synthase family O-acyltransferase [Solimonas sp.]|nr:wax ester/triacylglycerol synthase family O-acyltransferase [Solimonas sp.]